MECVSELPSISHFSKLFLGRPRRLACYLCIAMGADDIFLATVAGAYHKITATPRTGALQAQDSQNCTVKGQHVLLLFLPWGRGSIVFFEKAPGFEELLRLADDIQ